MPLTYKTLWVYVNKLYHFWDILFIRTHCTMLCTVHLIVIIKDILRSLVIIELLIQQNSIKVQILLTKVRIFKTSQSYFLLQSLEAE